MQLRVEPEPVQDKTSKHKECEGTVLGIGGIRTDVHVFLGEGRKENKPLLIARVWQRGHEGFPSLSRPCHLLGFLRLLDLSEHGLPGPSH